MPNRNRNQRQKSASVGKPDVAATDSQATAAKASTNGSSEANTQVLRELYASLLRCRRVQEWIRQSPKADYEITIGHEAVTVGSTAELDTSDTITSSPRNLAALLARGVRLGVLNPDRQTGGQCSMPALPADPFNLGTGIALAHKLDQQRRVVVSFPPQPKPALEIWHDALRFAAMQKLPIIFVIENGIAADSSTLDDAPHLEPCSFFTRDYGFPGIIVDGNDVVAVWRVAHEAINRARIGSGPTLIDCRTDAPHDPLLHMEHYLRIRGAWDKTWHRQLEAEITATIAQASVDLPPVQKATRQAASRR